MLRKSLYILFLIPYFFTNAQTTERVDYSVSANWAVLPGVSTPEWVEHVEEEPYKEIDVFYVYPTLLTAKKDKRWNYDISDEEHHKDVMEKAVKYQASAWASAGSVYVPFYRQAHIRSYRQYRYGGKEALELAYSNVKAAFQYYLENYNKGKGIILAGHSQGSTHMSRIIKEFFDGQLLQKQLVAAYIPGIAFNEEEFGTVKLMVSPAETGGYVTWNTLKKKYNTKRYQSYYKGKACINPVSWNKDAIAERDTHKGFLYANDKVYSRSFDTHLVEGAVWITSPKSPVKPFTVFLKNYHVGDVNLFWKDISINARLRAKKYIEMYD